MENNQEREEMIFASGMGFRARHERAPETVRGSIYFKWNDFKKFCEENVDSKGFVNIKMMKSMKTQGIYFILDTYKPKTDPISTQEYNDTKYQPQSSLSTNQKEEINNKTAEKLFNQPLTEKEQFNLSDIPF